MDSLIPTSKTAAIPANLVNVTSGSFLTSLQANSSRRPSPLTIGGQTTSQTVLESMAAAAPIGRGSSGTWSVQGGASPSVTGVSGTAAPGGAGAAGEDEDVFGEHYFHICIYIWVFVVVSSLIALSVKWGCCGRSLTRWEVKKIPLRKFHRTEGDECHDKCPICHESFHEGRLIRQLPCNHCYHSYCVDRWLVKMSNRCPLCKQRVSISLFCPWSKQRRNKEGGGGMCGSGGQDRLSMAELETEASVDESPPVPPLSTLTPSSWYGEDIMSGPSKFVIMRPGRPTRVIDVREQNKTSKTVAETCGEMEAPGKEDKLEGCTSEGDDCGSFSKSQTDKGVNDSSDSKGGTSVVVLNSHSMSPSLCDHNHCHYHHHHIEQHQHHPVLDELQRSPSNRSSRSCSVSSDLPLLSTGQCTSFGDMQLKGGHEGEGRPGPDSSRCLCQDFKGDNPNGIPSATTRITATPELDSFPSAKRDNHTGAVRHVQVISLHNHYVSPCSSTLQQSADLSDCPCGKESSLTPFAERCPRPVSLPDETTVFLSSGSSSVLTGSGDKETTSRLSLPHHLVQHGSGSMQSQADITSLSLNSLPARSSSPRLHHTVIDTPITYLGSECKKEGEGSKDRKHKELKESRRNGKKCSVEAIAPLSCHVLLPEDFLSRQGTITGSGYPDCAPSMAKTLEVQTLSVEMEPNKLTHGPINKSKRLQEAWNESCNSLTDLAIQPYPSDSSQQFDAVLTTLPASTVLFSENSPPPPIRKPHRRSNDYSCKHL